MINKRIINLALFTKNVGLKNKFTHKSFAKNSLCGDKIKTEFIVKKSIIKSMRYETESCILCEASASLFSRKIKNFEIHYVKDEIEKFKKFKNKRNYKFPKKLNEFNTLINEESSNRLTCVILPMEAFLKAFKMLL